MVCAPAGTPGGPGGGEGLLDEEDDDEEDPESDDPVDDVVSDGWAGVTTGVCDCAEEDGFPPQPTKEISKRTIRMNDQRLREMNDAQLIFNDEHNCMLTLLQILRGFDEGADYNREVRFDYIGRSRWDGLIGAK